MKRVPSLLFAGVFVCVTSAAAADPINITGGSLDMNPSSGPLALFGDRGFTFLSHVDNVGGLFQPTDQCNGNPAGCPPGATLGLAAAFSGNDLTGTATLDGHAYDRVGSLGSLASADLRFAGSIVLPPLASSATVTAPFLFSGTFFHPIGTSSSMTGETLRGRGVATLLLTPNRAFADSWHLDRAVYQFAQDPAATPEPGPLLLTGVGLIALAALSRRSVRRGGWLKGGAGRPRAL
jgi:hypothetical protein